jgi:hypothetical protein
MNVIGTHAATGCSARSCPSAASSADATCVWERTPSGYEPRFEASGWMSRLFGLRGACRLNGIHAHRRWKAARLPMTVPTYEQRHHPWAGCRVAAVGFCRLTPMQEILRRLSDRE